MGYPCVSYKLGTQAPCNYTLMFRGFFYVIGLGLVFWMGWLKVYTDGMPRSNALKNRTAVKNLVSMVIQLSFGSLLEYGEWELLTVFIASLGRAEDMFLRIFLTYEIEHRFT